LVAKWTPNRSPITDDVGWGREFRYDGVERPPIALGGRVHPQRNPTLGRWASLGEGARGRSW